MITSEKYRKRLLTSQTFVFQTFVLIEERMFSLERLFVVMKKLADAIIVVLPYGFVGSFNVL